MFCCFLVRTAAVEGGKTASHSGEVSWGRPNHCRTAPRTLLLGVGVRLLAGCQGIGLGLW
jgi:hypothetical protein